MKLRNDVREVLAYVLSLFRDYVLYIVAAVLLGLALLLRVPDGVLMAAAGIALVALLVYYRYTESKRLKMRTYEAMSPEMKKEIDTERRQNMTKRQKFLEAMDKAGVGPGGTNP